MATKTRFLNPKTMAPPPGYTYVVETTGPGRTVYIAGQLGLDLDNKLVGGPGDFGAQCERAFENLGHALASVGATFSSRLNTVSRASLPPTIWAKSCSPWISSCR